MYLLSFKLTYSCQTVCVCLCVSLWTSERPATTHTLPKHLCPVKGDEIVRRVVPTKAIPHTFFWASRARLQCSFSYGFLALRGAPEAWGMGFSEVLRLCAEMRWAPPSTCRQAQSRALSHTPPFWTDECECEQRRSQADPRNFCGRCRAPCYAWYITCNLR